MPEQALVARLALAGLVATGIAAFARAQGAPGAWVLLLPVALSLVAAPARLPVAVQRALSYGARAWMAATAFLALLASIYPIFADATIARASLLLGYGLAGFSAVFLLGRRVWQPASNALPCAVGTLATASLQPTAALSAFHAAAVLCLLAFAFAAAETIEPPRDAGRNRFRRVVRLLVFTAAASALAVGIARFLPWAQPRVEEATARALNPSYAISQPAFSEHARLGSVEALALSHRVVLRMWSEHPLKLRGRVLVDFDGQTWHGARTPLHALLPVGATLPAPASLSEWLSEVEGESFAEPGLALEPSRRARLLTVLELAGPLMTPAGTRLLRLRASSLARDGFGIVQGPGGLVEAYAVVQGPLTDVPDLGDLPLERYLAVHPDTDPRLRALAAQLGADARTEEERIARTLEYLGRELHYSLSPGKFQSRQPIAEFVFEKKKGYCEYFASAAAALLRLQGVPTRYVSGFAPSEQSRIAGHFVVRESHAHAWIEALVPGRGWVEVDPTPAAQLADFRAGQEERWFGRAWDWLTAAWAALRARLSFGGWTRIGALLRAPAVPVGIALLLAGVGLFLLRRFRPRRKTRVAAPAADQASQVPPEIEALLASLDAAWARRGHRRPPHRAPLEHVRGLTSFPAEAQAACARAVDCFYAARFGRRYLPAAEVAHIRAEMDRTLGTP